MKKLFICTDFNLLAEKLIEEISACWKDPFNSPVVIFPDSKVEQWFKLCWLKKNKSVLMNLKTGRLESLLRDLITEQSKSEKIHLLSNDLLKNLIYIKLLSKTSSGEYFYKTLNAPEINFYLEESDGKINLLHLYDFAAEMAELFNQYETNRPDFLAENKKDGVIKCWKNNQLYFSKENPFKDSPNSDEEYAELKKTEEWQIRLYNAVLGEEIILDNEKYFTLPELFQMQESSGNLNFEFDEKKNVFLFGFSGLGQFYTRVLNLFAEKNDLYIFQQTAGEEASTENEFSKNWAYAGNQTVKLWNCKAEKIPAAYKDDSLLHNLQKDISENKKISTYKKDSSIKITSAPSKLREVENLHSEISNLLKSGKADLSEILVVTPNLENYKIPILQVFSQNEKDDKDFPTIPYRITDYSSKVSLVAEAVGILTDIILKGTLNRSDIFSFIRNVYIQQVCNLEDEEISSWVKWTQELNVYRNRDEVKDWEKAKNRLLLSRLNDNLVKINDEEFLPYSTIETEEGDTLYNFIDLIDSLEKLIQLGKKENLTLTDIEEFHNFLDKYFLFKKSSKDFISEQIVYQNVADEIQVQKKLFSYLNSNSISSQSFLFSVLTAAQGTSFSSGSVFTNGITFMNLQPNRILSAKYVFMLGMDSASFPGKETVNVLDLSANQKISGDYTVAEKNRNAFYCQILNSGEGLFISYVNQNLQKEEEFYKSTVVNQLCKLASICDEEEISIDEKRKWSELFTSRSFRNKENFIRLNQLSDAVVSEEAESESVQEKAENLPDRVSLFQIRSYLEDPFIAMVNSVLSETADSGEAEGEAYEPLSIDNLTNAAYVKEYVKAKLEGNWNPEEFEQDLKNRNCIPDKYFGEFSLKKIYSYGDIIFDSIRENFPTVNFVLESQLNLHLNYAPKDKSWSLTGKASWYNDDFITEGALTLLDINSSQNIMGGYVSALALIASLPETVSPTQNFDVDLYNANKRDGCNLITNFTLNKKTALECLNKIYEYLFVEEYHVCIPNSLVEVHFNNPKNDIKSLDEFADYVTGLWEYFEKARLFDPAKDLGYTEENFSTFYDEALNHQRTVLLYV